MNLSDRNLLILPDGLIEAPLISRAGFKWPKMVDML